jgi:HEPN domain-containing protein
MTPPSNPPPGSPADWVRHAESDLHLARLGKDEPDVLRNQLAVHAQQAAEKAIKAVLLHHAVRFPRTHDLETLTELVRLAKLAWPLAADEISALSPYAVELRYPGGYAEISQQELANAITAAAGVVQWARGEVGG